jgi:hypothetical protein
MTIVIERFTIVCLLPHHVFENQGPYLEGIGFIVLRRQGAELMTRDMPP